jgi:hypothetical protein
MNRTTRAEIIVRDMERLAPYMYEGLYGTFLRAFMDSDRSEWTQHMSQYLVNNNQDWNEVGTEIALLLWERFEKRITC